MNGDRTELSPVGLREVRYDELFRGEIPYEPLPDDMQVGLAGLCRITERRAARPAKLQAHLDSLPNVIDNILAEHDEAAVEGNPSLFSFIDEDTRRLVGGVVTDVFTQWEVTASRNGLDSLLGSSNSESKWLVIETAAAVMEATAQTEGNFNIREVKRDKKVLTKLIYNWGPKFVRQWFDGTIIEQWMTQESIPSAEQTEWQEIFNPANRKYFAFANNNDPLKALAKVKNHLETTLAVSSIAGYLGWDEREAAETFTPGIRKQIAILNPTNPLKALTVVKTNLETILTDDNIAAHLGWTTEEVAEFFSPSFRRTVAVTSPTDPMKTLHKTKRYFEVTLTDANIAAHLGWTTEEVAYVFTVGVKKSLVSHGYALDPLQLCQEYIDGKRKFGGPRSAHALHNKLKKLNKV